MIRILYRTEDGRVATDLRTEDLPALLREPAGLLWLDIEGESHETCRPILLETFGFHPLAVDDALEEAHVPRVDDWQDYLYLVLHAVHYDAQSDMHVSTSELDLFMGRRYMVTYHVQTISAIERVWAACQRDGRHMARGAGHLLYRLTDELVADYMPVVDEIDGEIDEIEDQVFDKPQPVLLERIFSLKRSLVHLRRIIAPQREVLNKLARGDYDVIDEERSVFFRDVYDHLVRLYDITESLRDLVAGVLDTYLSVVSNRTNEVMRTLTTVTTLFLPASFVAGFLGMNVFMASKPVDLWASNNAFEITIAAMALAPVIMYLWIRRQTWK